MSFGPDTRRAAARFLRMIRAQTALRRARRGSASNRAGFTLVELMVVIVIIGLLATVVAINVLPSFPTDLQALVAAPAGLANPDRYRPGGYVRRLPEDPWGNPYGYRRPSAQGGQFDVFSLGADGKEGGEGNDADLGNWQA